MRGKFKFRGWSILGLINTYLGWRYNKLIVISLDLETENMVNMFLIDADEYDRKLEN